MYYDDVIKGGMTSHMNRVWQMMKKTGQIPRLTEESIQLRINVITEEYKELMQALGYSCVVNLTKAQHMESVPEILKELCDLQVVTTGGFVMLGYGDHVPIEIVDNNNLTKFGEGSTIRADGKLLPPPTFNKKQVRIDLANFVAS